MKRRLHDVESAIASYLARLDETDQTEPSPDDAKTLQDKVAELREEMSRLIKLEVRMLETPSFDSIVPVKDFVHDFPTILEFVQAKIIRIEKL